MKGLYIDLLAGIVGLSVATNFVRPALAVTLSSGAFMLFVVLIVVYAFERLYKAIK